MRVFTIFYFLTFVLSSTTGICASTPKTTQETTPYEAETDEYLNSISRENFAPRKQYEGSLSFGYAGGNFLEEHSWPQGPDINIRLESLDRNEVSRFFGEISLTQKDFYSIGFGKKFMISEEDSFTPYGVLSLNGYSEYDDNIKGLMKLNRLRLRAAAGFGNLINFEFGTGLSLNGPDLYMRLGFKQKF